MEIEIFNNSELFLEIDKQKLKFFFEGALKSSEFQMVKQVEANVPTGYKVNYLCDECSFTIHIFQIQEKSFVEITCFDFEKYIYFIKYIQNGKKAGLIV